MIVLVTGGRDLRDVRLVYDALDAIHARVQITRVVQGGARGADDLARSWAMSRRVDYVTYAADWAQGRAAGLRRNQDMLNEEAVQLVVAFPGGRGTADMVRRAVSAGIPVEEQTR